MEHLLLKAATTATDEGTFTAVISTATVDRDKDIIEPAAMVASLAKWAGIGKLVPLAWNHTEEVVGHIDPATAVVKDGEVVADGWVDQSVPRGEETWRLVKSGTLSFSFGFLFEPKTQASKLPNGGYRVKELDVFEVSVIPVGPANNDTRVLNYKALTDQGIFDAAELEAAVAGELKAVWTSAYLAELPDSAFLHVEGKSRQFPVRDVDGSTDPPHLRYALSRIPQTDLPESVKDRLTGEAQRMLDTKAVEASDEDRSAGKSRTQDPLRKRSNAVLLEVRTDGLSLLKEPQVKEQPKREAPPEGDLRRRSRDLMLRTLIGME